MACAEDTLGIYPSYSEYHPSSKTMYGGGVPSLPECLGICGEVERVTKSHDVLLAVGLHKEKGCTGLSSMMDFYGSGSDIS